MTTPLSTDQRLKRAVCTLLGCYLDQHPCCERCGTDLYDAFIERGWLDPIFRSYWSMYRALRKLGPRKCGHCGKKFLRGYNDETCSEACFNDWLPF
jgi:hypothetical protein